MPTTPISATDSLLGESRGGTGRTTKTVSLVLTPLRGLAAAAVILALVAGVFSLGWLAAVAGGGGDGGSASTEPNPSKNSSTGAMPSFGREMREKMFDAIEKDIVFLNHGSYGACPRPVLDAQLKYLRQMEAEPCRFFAREVRPELKKVREFFAPFINASAEDIVWVENASGAVNAILRSLNPASGDILLHLNVAYGMVEKTLEFLAQRWGAKMYAANVTLPLSPEKIVRAVDGALSQLKKEGKTVAVASFSHISSTPAIILPIKELIELCHNHSIPVMIDGAHALGQVPLDMEDLGAEWYLSNGHKWLDSPKGSAFLWTRKDVQAATHPTVISFGYDTTPPNSYQKEFEWTGTRDLTPLLAMRDATEFLFVDNDINAVWDYQRSLCTYANEQLASMWNSAPMTNDTRLYSALTNVRLPDIGKLSPGQVQNSLLFEHNIESVIYAFEGAVWTRVSCQIYNTREDIDKLGQAVLDIIARGHQEMAFN